jgi:hypothetical protein
MPGVNSLSALPLLIGSLLFVAVIIHRNFSGGGNRKNKEKYNESNY